MATGKGVTGMEAGPRRSGSRPVEFDSKGPPFRHLHAAPWTRLFQKGDGNRPKLWYDATDFAPSPARFACIRGGADVFGWVYFP